MENGKVVKLVKWLLQTEKSYDAIAPDLKNLPSKAHFVMDTQDVCSRKLSARLRRSEAQPREQGAAAKHPILKATAKAGAPHVPELTQLHIRGIRRHRPVPS